MGHKNLSLQIKGVFITNVDDGPNLDFALNEPAENWEDNIEEEEIPLAKALLEKIRALAKGDKIYSVYECQVTGTGALAVGWFESINGISNQMVADLEKVLNDAGFKTNPIENDRFETYG